MTLPKRAAVAYPLGQHLKELLKSKTGMRYEDVTLDSLREGKLGPNDLSIGSDTLRMQARAAADAGYPQLASNLSRAAELVRIPNERLLEIYGALRPHHSTKAQLLAISDELRKKYHAPDSARFVREAAEAYRDSGLLKAPRPGRARSPGDA